MRTIDPSASGSAVEYQRFLSIAILLASSYHWHLVFEAEISPVQGLRIRIDLAPSVSA
jgi:hypothetical protein